MKTNLLALAGLLMCSTAGAQPPGAPVGKIPAKCPATIVKASEFVPDPKLKLSPEEAVTAAETAHRIKCNSKLLQEVFADAENYYITRFGSSSIVVVDGRTGNVSVREAK